MELQKEINQRLRISNFLPGPSGSWLRKEEEERVPTAEHERLWAVTNLDIGLEHRQLSPWVLSL